MIRRILQCVLVLCVLVMTACNLFDSEQPRQRIQTQNLRLTTAKKSTF